jgi:hypothetical protein
MWGQCLWCFLRLTHLVLPWTDFLLKPFLHFNPEGRPSWHRSGP